MSLVAYASSSDDDSSSEESIAETQEKKWQKEQFGTANATIVPTVNEQTIVSSDDINNDDVNILRDSKKLQLILPQPKTMHTCEIEEEDDEFLHKKVASALIEKVMPQTPKVTVRAPVKILIPSLTDFENEPSMKSNKPHSVGPEPNRPSGLLGRLPPPKSIAFLKATEPSVNNTKPHLLIPHNVANRIKEAREAKPAHSVVNVKKPTSDMARAMSDDSDPEEDSDDFFSLNIASQLPEVSACEIEAMVSKRANKMAKFSKHLEESQRVHAQEDDSTNIQAITPNKPSLRDQYDLEALIGTRAAKHARHDNINFIEISQDEVKASQEEWMRTSLQAETEPQQGYPLPGAPGAGTRKRHQITYLAYQAKANEQELQAMWAANRQSRRQTQSKYGF